MTTPPSPTCLTHSRSPSPLHDDHCDKKRVRFTLEESSIDSLSAGRDDIPQGTLLKSAIWNPKDFIENLKMGDWVRVDKVAIDGRKGFSVLKTIYVNSIPDNLSVQVHEYRFCKFVMTRKESLDEIFLKPEAVGRTADDDDQVLMPFAMPFLDAVEVSTPRERLIMVKEMVNCVDKFLGAGLIHCDLKPDNFVFHQGHVKLIDLGHTQKLEDPDVHEIVRQVELGTVGFLAPELAAKADLHTYGEQTEVFALGVSLGVILNSAPGELEKEDVFLAKLALECCEVDPAARPTLEALLHRLRNEIEKCQLN